ncbi:MAG: TlpA family thioredoxin-disulfide reductase [Spirochaetes bacterium]|nr:MAG: TlpA family thioredoxin-disulfide reductase [Spirochaetota bacterium]
MQKRTGITIRLLAVFLTFAALAAIAALPAFGASPKPWYAAKLEALGFYVFDPPFIYQDFKVTTLDGGSKTRTSTKGKIVLLNFWATWCPPCRQEIPSIENLGAAMKGHDFEIFAVSVGEDLATVKSFVAEMKMTFPVYLDPKNTLTRTYASQGIPTTYILDKTGKFIAGMVGAHDYSSPELIALLKELAQK